MKKSFVSNIQLLYHRTIANFNGFQRGFVQRTQNRCCLIIYTYIYTYNYLCMVYVTMFVQYKHYNFLARERGFQIIKNNFQTCRNI